MERQYSEGPDRKVGADGFRAAQLMPSSNDQTGMASAAHPYSG